MNVRAIAEPHAVKPMLPTMLAMAPPRNNSFGRFTAYFLGDEILATNAGLAIGFLSGTIADG